MKIYRKYFGKRFYQQKDGYWANIMPIHAHRWVWINHHGAIPQNMDIHHINGDKSNNEIENLEMLSRSDHLKRHWQEGRFDLEKRRTQLAEARKWLQTPEGRKKQKDDAHIGWKKRKGVLIVCKCCGKEKKTMQSWTKFCSDACSIKFKRRQKRYLIEEICPICHMKFMRDKFSPKRFCSISCGAKNSAKNRNIVRFR